MLTGKTIILGVTGSIAAYKIANLTSMLTKLNADVHVLMTENALQASIPVSGSTTIMPKSLSFCMFACVTGFSYRLTFIAGATIFLHLQGKRTGIILLR